MVNFHIPRSLEEWNDKFSLCFSEARKSGGLNTLLYVVLTGTVEAGQAGPRPRARPGAAQQLGRLPLGQGLDGVLRVALGVASVAAQHEIPSQHGSVTTRHDIKILKSVSDLKCQHFNFLCLSRCVDVSLFSNFNSLLFGLLFINKCCK